MNNPQKTTSVRHAVLRGLYALIGLLLAAGCGLQPSPAMQLDLATERNGVLFQDDFLDPKSGWGVWSGEGALVDYQQGALHFVINEPQFDYWSVAGQEFQDVQIEVDTVKWAGPDDNDFGVICRYVDRQNFYLLVISSDGYYGIAKMVAGEYSMIGAELLQYSSAILKGQAINHLRADCVGSTLRLYANSQLLMEVQDRSFASGDVGLIAGSYGEGGVEVFFDNFLVQHASE